MAADAAVIADSICHLVCSADNMEDSASLLQMIIDNQSSKVKMARAP